MYKKAFTLIEMLIVVVVIGILGTALIPRLQNSESRARDVQRKVDISTIANALSIYKQDHGKYRSSFVHYPSLLSDPYGCWDDKCSHMDLFDLNAVYAGENLSLSSIPNDPLKTSFIYPLTVMDFWGFDGLMFGEQTYVTGHYAYIRDVGYDDKELVFLVANVENLGNANFGKTTFTSLIEFKTFTDIWGWSYDEMKPFYESSTSSDESFLCKKITYNINPEQPTYRDMEAFIDNCKIFASNEQNAIKGQYYVKTLR